LSVCLTSESLFWRKSVDAATHSPPQGWGLMINNAPVEF
jgi:hypothetical protein